MGLAVQVTNLVALVAGAEVAAATTIHLLHMTITHRQRPSSPLQDHLQQHQGQLRRKLKVVGDPDSGLEPRVGRLPVTWLVIGPEDNRSGLLAHQGEAMIMVRGARCGGREGRVEARARVLEVDMEAAGIRVRDSEAQAGDRVSV